MKTLLKATFATALITFASCKKDDDVPPNPPVTSVIEFKNHSELPVYLKLAPEFSDVKIYNILSSSDVLPESPEFVYGSMADGAGLLKNDDGTFTMINNIEADYSIASIKLDKTFKPVSGSYILSSVATGATAQCSGSMITPEEHGFGPLYLSGGEWGGASKGVFVTDPYKDPNAADVAEMLPSMGQWSTENAVAIGQDAFPGKTIVFIGDDNSNDEIPSGQLGMYVGEKGDLNGGKLYGLKVISPDITFEVDMLEGQTYQAEFVEYTERTLEELDAEAKEKGIMGFSRLEDIDWRRGSAANNREIYMAVTGRLKDGLVGRGTLSGRVYRVTLSENDPLKATITCVLDGDILDGKAAALHSPDNILVTENYAYIQEDPNGVASLSSLKDHKARLYQYNLNTGVLKDVLDTDQAAAAADGIGDAGRTWELTGMIDISDIVDVPESFILITQNHGWEKEEGDGFTDPKAVPPGSLDGREDVRVRKEGSMCFVITGLER